MAEKITPELDAHLMTKFGDLLQRTRVALGGADEVRFGQGNDFVFRHREFAQTQRRAHPERVPVR
ncbi:hypothetical protein D3C75_1368480 [compost metagenome]